MSDTFLSYNRRDGASAAALVSELRVRSIATFFDREALTAGRSWQTEIEQALDVCRSFCILLGSSGLGNWQRQELALALDRSAKDKSFSVIPVLLPGADPPLGLLGQRTWIELTPSDSTAVDILVSAINGEPPSAALRRAAEEARATVCPYRGLASFREEDAGFFFGRNSTIDELESRMAGRGLTALIGPSGSGKSSIAQAGLLPRLRRADSGALAAAVMQPRSDPFLELARHLLALREPDLPSEDALPRRRKIASFLASEPAALSDWIEETLQERGSRRFLLLVDQWEEVYTSVESEDTRTQFVDALLAAIDRTPLTVLITLRGDYLGHALSRTDMVERLQGGTVVVGPMDRDNLRRTIEEPGRLLSIPFQPGLVERMLDEVEGEPGTLPLLQFLLEGLWRSRQGGAMTHDAYAALGGVRGAITKQADDVFSSLRAADQAVARDLLVNLVRPGEGTLDSRRFVDLAGLPEPARRIVYQLGQKRLLVADDRQVQVTHEALIREWDRLRDWVNEDREFLRVRDRLEPEARAWHKAGEAGADDLLIPPGRRLDEARDLLRNRPTLLEGEALIEYYVAASVVKAERDTAAREAERRRTIRRIRRWAYALGVSAVVAVGFAIWAILEQRHAVAVADDLRRANVMAVDAGDRFVTRSADRLRQVAGVPAAKVEELLRDGEAFFKDLAEHGARDTPDLARSLARMQISFADTSGDLGDLAAQKARAEQARRQLEPLAASGQATAQDLLSLSRAWMMQAEAENSGREWSAAVRSADQARGYAEAAQKAGGDAQVAGLAQAESEGLAARALARLPEQGSDARARAEACLRNAGHLVADLTSDHYAMALCHWALGFVLLDAPDRKGEARDANASGLAYAKALVADDPNNQRYQHLAFSLTNNIGVATDDEKQRLNYYAEAMQIARAQAKLDTGNLPAQDSLSLTLRNVGLTSAALGMHDKAAESFEEAYEISRRLEAAQPLRSDWSSNVELNLSSLAFELRNDLPDDPRRLSVERVNLELQTKLATANPTDKDHRIEAFDALYWTAQAFQQQGNGNAAFALSQQAIEAAEPFRSVDDADRRYRANLYFSVLALGKAADTARPGTRLPLLLEAERTIEHYTNLDPRVWSWRSELAYIRVALAKTYAGQGENTRALQEALLAGEQSSSQDAAQLLADWYRTGSGPTPIDGDRATYWESEARQRPSRMERFTVPSTMQGSGEKVQCFFYTHDPYDGSDPVEEEIYGIEHYQGITLPDDVKGSFRKLLKIAVENHVSFNELAVYALGDKAGPDTELALKVEAALLRSDEPEAERILRDAPLRGTTAKAVLLVTAKEDQFGKEIADGMPPDRVKLGPVEILFGFGEWLLAQHNNPLASANFAALLEGERLSTFGQAEALRLRGKASERVDDTAAAEQDLLRSLALRPTQATTLGQLGLLWADRGTPALTSAFEVFGRAVAGDATLPDTLAGLGWVLVQQGKVPEGVRLIEGALVAAPREPRYMDYLGEGRRRAGDLKAARALWTEALALDPEQHVKTMLDAHLKALGTEGR